MTKKRTRTRPKPSRRSKKPTIRRRPRRQKRPSRPRRTVTTRKVKRQRGHVKRERRSRTGRRPQRRGTKRTTGTQRVDRKLRRLKIPVATGIRSIAVTRGNDASLIGRYWNAVHRYLARGDTAALNKFVGVSITTAQRKQVRLLTDLATLDRLASAGVLSFESIYGRTA